MTIPVLKRFMTDSQLRDCAVMVLKNLKSSVIYDVPCEDSIVSLRMAEMIKEVDVSFKVAIIDVYDHHVRLRTNSEIGFKFAPAIQIWTGYVRN